MLNKNTRLKGVGGWLALLVHGLLWIGPLSAIGRTNIDFSAVERQYPGLSGVPEWSTFKIVEWIAVLVFCAISLWGGLGLAKQHTPDAVSRAKIVLWLVNPIQVMVIGMAVPAVMIDSGDVIIGENIPYLFASIIGACIWNAYLSRSVRVKNTYGLCAVSPIKEDIDDKDSESEISGPISDKYESDENNSVSSSFGKETKFELSKEQTGLQSFDVNEDQIFASIAEELEKGILDKGLWTRLFSENEGDEKQTKVSYINIRADRLISQERARLAEDLARKESAEEEWRLERQKWEKIDDESKKCPFCGQLNNFGSDVCIACDKPT